MRKMYLCFVMVCLMILSSGVMTKTASAAGTAKPTEAGREGSYDVISVNSKYAGGTTKDCGLFDGSQVNEWNTSNVMYWYQSSDNLEIKINESCNIWRSGTTGWPYHNNLLRILKWDGTQYIDITSSCTQKVTKITNTTWEKSIANIQPGKYKFVCAGYRLDSEWYLEATTPVKNLIATPGDSQVNLSWDATDKETSFKIKRSTNSDGPYELVDTCASNSFTDTGLKNGVTYYYVISVVNSDGVISDTKEVSAIPTTKEIDKKLKVVLEVGEELQLSVEDDLSVSTDLIWNSSDTSVAAVNEYGVVTALKSGDAVITVKNKDGSYMAYINVLVVDDADDYRLAVDLKVGKSCRLTIDDLKNMAAVTWSSMDPSIGTVSTKGKVQAVSAGLTIITATDSDGKVIGQIYVRVRKS